MTHDPRPSVPRGTQSLGLLSSRVRDPPWTLGLVPFLFAEATLHYPGKGWPGLGLVLSAH